MVFSLVGNVQKPFVILNKFHSTVVVVMDAIKSVLMEPVTSMMKTVMYVVYC
tara:strand:- start:13 stop:168 length:156 start_codon:yes stop_codon:yes gene_type:complete